MLLMRRRPCHNIDTMDTLKEKSKRAKMAAGGSGGRKSRRTEAIAWAIVCFQFLYIMTSGKSPIADSGSNVRGGGIAATITTATDPKSLIMNDHSSARYDRNAADAGAEAEGDEARASYDTATIHPQSAGLVSRVWHSNGSPAVHGDNKYGSCWCGADEWCMCTASLAVDLVLTSGPEHFLLVQRKDTGQYATMGGFVEVGESSAETVVRELKEEMNIDIELDELTLFGIYSDPKRDARRHTASIAYAVDVPEDIAGRAGDDAAKVARVHVSEIDNLDFFADHKTILQDFIAQREGSGSRSANVTVKRDVCSMK